MTNQRTTISFDIANQENSEDFIFEKVLEKEMPSKIPG
jgi:hypothetical protein